MPRHEELHTYDDVGREVVVERPVPRRRVRFATSPSQIVSAAVGLVVLGLVLLAEPSDLVADLNTEADLGWLGLIAGALLVLSALLAPRPRRDLELT